jgi:hypothetical protein
MIPDNKDGFALTFEGNGKSERILCTLQNTSTRATSPFAGKFKKFGPLPVKTLEDIPDQFAKFGGLKDWVLISRNASR